MKSAVILYETMYAVKTEATNTIHTHPLQK